MMLLGYYDIGKLEYYDIGKLGYYDIGDIYIMLFLGADDVSIPIFKGLISSALQGQRS